MSTRLIFEVENAQKAFQEWFAVKEGDLDGMDIEDMLFKTWLGAIDYEKDRCKQQAIPH